MTSHRPFRSRYIPVRGLRYHLREWGPADAEAERRIVFLHGWMDVSASFQFVVDALSPNWHVVAPDWRGYGKTERPPADCYWFPDYLADLELILDQLQPDTPVQLAGHSMGGNIAMLYAGVRPARVRSVVNVEGFGLRGAVAAEAPARYAQWIDQLKAGGSLRDYASLEEVALRLQRNNARLSAERADFLAQHWAEADGRGRLRVAGDPAHRIVNPVLYRLDEVLTCWRAIACPVLCVRGADSEVLRYLSPQRDEALAELARRLSAIADNCEVVIDDAGHMLHHDQPEALARVATEFLARRR